MIQRANNNSPFAMIKIDVLRSGLLTLEELGLYTVMLSRTDNWEFSEFVLARELGMTPGEVHDILKRLERKGFTRERMGRRGSVWDLYELSDLLPKGEPHRDYTVPQDVAKAFVDSVMKQGTDTLRKSPEDPLKTEPDRNSEPGNESFVSAPEHAVCPPDRGTAPPDGEGKPMSREEIGRTLIEFAAKLRQHAAAQKTGGMGLPNAGR